jgi:hypothetical protein
MTLVLRPHPSENHGVYHELASRCTRVRVTHQGNVLPWLLACRALVHNGCTTAIESYAMGVPSVTYLKTFNAEYDLDFQGLPNRLSLQCRTLDELVSTLKAMTARGAPTSDASPERDRLIDHYITARSGRLATERILDVLDSIYGSGRLPSVALPVRMRASVLTRIRALKKLKLRRPGNYHDHRFPRMSADDVAQRIDRLGRTLGRFGGVKVSERGEHLFDVYAGSSRPR